MCEREKERGEKWEASNLFTSENSTQNASEDVGLLWVFYF